MPVSIALPLTIPQSLTYLWSALYEPPTFIPSENSGRTLVLCFDGTGDQYVLLSSDLYLIS